MKKMIFLLWMVAILAIVLIFMQNQALYLTEQKLSLNLILYKISFPPLHNGSIILLFFAFGVLLSAAGRLFGVFKARKALKKCESTGQGYIDKIGELKNQVDQMKIRGGPKAAAPEKTAA